MIKRTAMLCAVVVALAAADERADEVLDRLQKGAVTYAMPLPPGAQVGDWWIEERHGGAQVVTTRFSITAEREGVFTLEAESTVQGLALVRAYHVDPKVDLGAVVRGKPLPSNVRAAWIGVRGGEARPTQVQPPPMYRAPTTPPVVREETLEVEGVVWETTRVELGDGLVKWRAKGSQFVVQSQYRGSLIERIAQRGKGAQSGLRWAK